MKSARKKDFKTVLDLLIWYRIDWDIQGQRHCVNIGLAQLLYYVRVVAIS